MNKLKALELKSMIAALVEDAAISSEEAGMLMVELADVYFEDAGFDVDDGLEEEEHLQDELVHVAADDPDEDDLDTRHRDAWKWLEESGFHLVKGGSADFPQYRLKGGNRDWTPRHSSNTPFGCVRQAMAEEEDRGERIADMMDRIDEQFEADAVKLDRRFGSVAEMTASVLGPDFADWINRLTPVLMKAASKPTKGLRR